MTIPASSSSSPTDEPFKKHEPQLEEEEQGVLCPESTTKPERPVNAYHTAPWWSQLFFSWPYPLLQIGMQRPLEDADLYDVLEEDSSLYNRDYFLRLWQAEQERAQSARPPQRPSLHRALGRDFFTSIWYVQPMMMIGAAAKVVQAVMLGHLIQSFVNPDGSRKGYLWAGMVVLTGLFVLFEHHHVFFFTWRKGMQMRIASIAAIHDKSLRLSSTHQTTSASYGRIMNLASNDVERFLQAALFICHLVWAPLQAIAILIAGCFMLGPAFAAGFGLLVVVFVPLQFYLSGKFAFFRSRIAGITDQRVTFVSQAVRGSRVMKMSGYEWRFLERIQEYRKSEVAQIIKANTLKAINEALFYATNVVVSIVIFVVHVYTGGTLQPGHVYAVFTLVNILQLEMTKHVSLGVMNTSEVYVSMTRIQNFLEFPEMALSQQSSTSESLEQADENANVISMSNVVSYWNEVQPVDQKDDSNNIGATSHDDGSTTTLSLALDNVSVDFGKGELTAVIGSVGSGKSALLQALVQELPISSGTVTRQYRTLAYAAQDPWVMDGTVKENIVMGWDYNEDWYNQVVAACSLAIDFRQFRDGDRTIVGDRGVQLSGGQRARIGLARAIYRDADLLVVDDPLSAVDSKVGRHIFQEALIGLGIKRGKSVILATHQHQYVSEHKCVLMDSGSIACVGSYEECVKASDGKLAAHAADDSVDNLADDNANTTTWANTSKQFKQQNDRETEENELNPDDDYKELSKTGNVEFTTYIKYIQAMGGLWVGFALLVLFCATQGLVVLTIVSIGKWSRVPGNEQKNWHITREIIAFGATVVFLALFRALLCFSLTIRASQKLHDRMAEAVLRAKIDFFDTNPLGRIMNRFSADVGSNDDLLPPTLFDFFVIAFMVLGAVITTVYTLPFTLIALPFLMWYFVSVRRIFITSTREMKRLEGMARSPIFAILSECLGGIATIRANDCVEFFQKKFRKAHDAHTRAFFAFIASSRWVGYRMDSIVFLFLTVVCFLAVLFQTQGWYNANPAILGLSISMLVQLAGIFQWCIRQSAEVVNQMVSVERVLGFGDLESEAALTRDEDKALLDQGWPSQGSIEFEDLSVRYRPSLPLVLDQVSFRIPPHSRVGIVGRTGSGKSTVVQTLFRLLEAEEGRILIDDHDISQIGLHALRTNISVIPQVPTLFSGCTVRENLDLFGLHSDESLQRVLKACHLDQVMADLPLGWNSLVAENGSNFSVGQRQLLCLARAILAENQILVVRTT